MTIEFTTEEMDELFSLVADEVLQDRLLKGLSITSDNQNEIMEEVYAIIFKIFGGDTKCPDPRKNIERNNLMSFEYYE